MDTVLIQFDFHGAPSTFQAPSPTSSMAMSLIKCGSLYRSHVDITKFTYEEPQNLNLIVYFAVISTATYNIFAAFTALSGSAVP